MTIFVLIVLCLFTIICILGIVDDIVLKDADPISIFYIRILLGILGIIAIIFQSINL